MMYAGIILAVLCVGATFADEELTHENEVHILTETNFDDFIKENNHVLIMFYAPWCSHCEHLKPEYEKAAQKLKESDSEIKLAKVDATKESKLAERHGVSGYPTLKFYRNQTTIDYSGGRTAELIITWITKKTGPAAKPLESVEDLKALRDENQVVIIGFFKDFECEESKAYLQACNAIDDHVFAITSNEEVIGEAEATHGTVILFKNFDEGKNTHTGEINDESLKKFISVYSLPLVVEFNQETAQKIFGGDIKNHSLVFLSKKAGHFDKYANELIEPAKKFREQMLFVTIDTDISDHDRILEFFGIQENEIPTMRIIQLEKDMAKYKPESNDMSGGAIMQFVTDFLAGKLSKHRLTEKLPADWDAKPVKYLVGTNFHEIAFDKTKNVLVEFYAPWCGHCKKLVPIYDQLGDKFEDKDDVVIAKFDATANELDDVKIDSFPTIILYKKDTNEAVEYSGDRTLEGLTKFVESNGKVVEAPEEAQEEDEDDDVPRRDEL